MQAIEVAKKVLLEGAHVLRVRKDDPAQYDAKPYFTGSRRGWTLLDRWTASAIVAVRNGLNETNRQKFETMPIERMAAVSFQLIKR